MSLDSLSTYEDWVKTLRAWRHDPMTDLSHLPSLDESSFPPATYQRFLNHLNDAVNEFMKHWQRQFVASFSAADDDHARARALVDAREGLGLRLTLANHPSFPQQIRDQLLAQTDADIRGLQQQLENDAQNVAAAASTSSRPQREATLRLIRDNALTAVLNPNFTPEPAVKQSPMPPRADTSPADFVPRQRARRIFDPNAQ